MKEIIIRQQHPIIEGVERKSITVDEENNCTVIVYGKKEEPKFKRGDIVANIFSISIIGDIDPIFQVERMLVMDGCVDTNEIDLRLATPEEQQILFTALAKEGKRWNAERLELEDILRVPENIKLYQPKKGSDQIYIGFGDRQLLGVHGGVWYVMIDDKDIPYKPIECELIPCNRDDLKAGDTASAHLTDDTSNLRCYCKILDNKSIVYISCNSDIRVADWVYEDLQWYKVVPIKE